MSIIKQQTNYYHHLLFLLLSLLTYLVLAFNQSILAAVAMPIWLTCYFLNGFFILRYLRSFSLSTLRLSLLTCAWVLYGFMAEWFAADIDLQIMLPLLLLAIVSVCMEAQVESIETP